MPLVLGLAGVIPFVALAAPVAPLLELPDAIVSCSTQLQAGYGATILSFLGKEERETAWPSIEAWRRALVRVACHVPQRTLKTQI